MWCVITIFVCNFKYHVAAEYISCEHLHLPNFKKIYFPENCQSTLIEHGWSGWIHGTDHAVNLRKEWVYVHVQLAC